MVELNRARILLAAAVVAASTVGLAACDTLSPGPIVRNDCTFEILAVNLISPVEGRQDTSGLVRYAVSISPGQQTQVSGDASNGDMYLAVSADSEYWSTAATVLESQSDNSELVVVSGDMCPSVGIGYSASPSPTPSG